MRSTKKDLFVYRNGKPVLKLHELLLTSPARYNLEKIKQIHLTKFDIYDAIESEEDLSLLKSYGADLILCEFELQKLWGFQEDVSFHKFWLAPKCTCPGMDNEERLGSGYFIIDQNCKLHGGIM